MESKHYLLENNAGTYPQVKQFYYLNTTLNRETQYKKILEFDFMRNPENKC